MATHSGILAWEISLIEGAWRATVHGIEESDMTEHTLVSFILSKL